MMMNANGKGSVSQVGDKALLAEVQGGLPIVPRPYAYIGKKLGLSEQQVLVRLRLLIDSGLIKRWGVVVRHRELGYRANAMVVWDIPEPKVQSLGRAMGEYGFVTLCYRRVSRPPDWPYSLFCMVHGRDRETVMAQIDHLVETLALGNTPMAVLFSARRFKQRGARYFTKHRED